MAEMTENEMTVEQIAAEAARAALDTEGVHSLLPGFTESIQENILRRSFDAPGIKVSISEKKIFIDMHLVTEYGYNIPAVAWNVQEHVKKRIELLQDLSVEVVNIHVGKIHFSRLPEESHEQKR